MATHWANKDTADSFTLQEKAALVQLFALCLHITASIQPVLNKQRAGNKRGRSWTAAADSLQLTVVAVLPRPTGDALAEVSANQIAA